MLCAFQRFPEMMIRGGECSDEQLLSHSSAPNTSFAFLSSKILARLDQERYHEKTLPEAQQTQGIESKSVRDSPLH